MGRKDDKDDNMTKNQFAYIIHKLDNNIKEFKSKRDQSKRRTHIIKASAIAVGASTTLLLGIKGYVPSQFARDLISISALVLSALTTAIASWDGFAQYAMKWVMARGTLVRLYAIRDELEFCHASGKDIPAETLKTTFKMLEDVLKTDTDNWTLRRVDAISSTSARHT